MTVSDDEERVAFVTQQYGGILPYFEAFYIQSISYAAERSEAAFKRFEKYVSKQRSPTMIFNSVQEALTHAGALSRFFWPIKKDEKLASARGAKLRRAFSLNEDSPLKWRRLRNAFEHFDEDLDRFLLPSRVGYFFPSPMLNNHQIIESEVGHIFKLVDAKNSVCVILGQRFEFGPIRNEVVRVLRLARRMDAEGSRLPRLPLATEKQS